MRDPVDPPGMSHLHRQNSVQQCEDSSSVCTETDGGNSDICNLADFSSEEEDIPVERNSGCQGENIIGVCDFAFAFKTQNAPCVSRFKRVLFSDRFQFAF